MTKGTSLPWTPRGSKPKAVRPETVQAAKLDQVRNFSRQFPIGTKVRYIPQDREVFWTIGFLRSRAVLLPDGTPAVQIAGVDGWVPLSKITPLDPPMDGVKAAAADFSENEED